MTLRRPDGLGDDEWEAISEVEARLLRAKAAEDLPLIVGSSKELCEAIAKVVIAERGSLASPASDIHELVVAAHRLLEFQPGEGLATEPDVRKIAQSLKSIVLGIGEMRNRYGTGHGRAVPSGIVAEHADLAYDAAHMWSAWALRRLEPYIAGDVSTLVRDLETSTFRSGDLARRLHMADLPRLSVEDQRRLGFAVAGRASRNTFVVIADGVDAVRAKDEMAWPRGYVQGLVTGLFLDPNGYLDVNEWKARESARLIAAMERPEVLVRDLVEKVQAAVLGGAVTANDDGLQAAAFELRKVAANLPSGEAQSGLERLAGLMDSNMEDMRAMLLEDRYRAQEGPEADGEDETGQDSGGGDAIRDYEGATIDYEGSADES